MLRSQDGVRVLGPADLLEARQVLEQDPITNVFADYRTRMTSMDPRWLGGEMWGYYEHERLVSMCHVAANLVPINATPRACEAFAERALRTRPHAITLVGPQAAVRAMWAILEPEWDTPRELRWDQPHLVISSSPQVAADPLVRRTTEDEIEALYPACVAMYTEEVGVSPEEDGGAALYRARVAQLIGRGWSFSRIDDGKVVFKAEIASASPYAAQVQGVYVAPEHRGKGLASAGMAAVVDIALREIAPAVSLYVNGHNLAARAAYKKVGFEQTATFSTIMM